MEKPCSATGPTPNASAAQPGPPCLLGVIADLLFETPIRHTAAQLGWSYFAAPNADALSRHLDRYRPTLVFVDMEIASQDAAAAIAACKNHPANPRVIAYYPHVQAHLAEAAHAAGADQVLPRSQFSSRLQSLFGPVKA